MRSRLTSNHFVGRVGELAELELAVREAGSSRPALVLLGGDSGVGKTRLVSELEQRLDGGGEAGQGAPLVLRGESVEQADGELPYAPLLSALRPLVRGRHPALDALSSGSCWALATILPGFEVEPRPRDVRASANDQVRLFEALLELLDRLSETSPLVLVLEDMHWADRSTRTFAAFLARTLRSERVCLILTYRTDELHRRHPLRPLLSELERLERAHRIELDPFDREELAEALADILGARPDDGLLDRLFARSEGNPLYTEELLAAGLDGRGTAPQSLRDAFLLRIERLSPAAQQLARAVAVGRALDEAALADVLDLDRGDLEVALRDALAEQVLVAGARGRFGFRHALLREALYDELLPGERGDLHIALARHLEREPDGATQDHEDELERISAIAGHYAAAGDQPAALRTTIAAAAAAHRALAYGEAATLLERALELWPRVPDAPSVAGLDHVELLRRTAIALAVLDDRARAEVLLRQALRELDPEREPARYAAILGRLSRFQWTLNRGAEAVETAERALAMLPADDPARVRPLLLAWLARVRFLRGRFREAATEGESALAAAVAAGDRIAECEVLNTLGMAHVALRDVDTGLGMLRRALTIAREEDDVDSIATVYTNLADMLILAGRTAEALAVAREGVASIPRHHPRSHNWLLLTLSEMALEAGDWALARESLPPRESGPLSGLLFMFRELREADLALATGDEEAAARCLDAVSDLVQASSEPQWIGLYGALQGVLLARRRDLQGARTAVQEALDRMELCTDDVMRIARVSVVGVQVEAERALRARDLREAADRRDALARARIHVQRLEAAAHEGGPVERARLAQGRAELARARGRGAARQWQRAAEAWLEVARPYAVATARWREAEALAEADDREGAAAAAAEALQGARRLGSEWLAREVQALAERARLDIRAADGAPEVAAHSEPEPDPFGLTPRERQVLALLAEGATNRQIGAALYMAEKTASVHVSRILAKLGVQGRTQAAAVAHRLHLA